MRSQLDEHKKLVFGMNPPVHCTARVGLEAGALNRESQAVWQTKGGTFCALLDSSASLLYTETRRWACDGRDAPLPPPPPDRSTVIPFARCFGTRSLVMRARVTIAIDVGLLRLLPYSTATYGQAYQMPLMHICKMP